MAKYDEETFALFQRLFRLLPIVTVLHDEVMIVHGGIPRDPKATLQQVEQLDTNKDIPQNADTPGNTLFKDLLWADPQSEDGIDENIFRSSEADNCIYFGPDVSRNFLEAHSLALCVRSHDVPSTLRGWQEHHRGLCITIFSASNYKGTKGNWGGVAEFFVDGGALEYLVHEYMSPGHLRVRDEARACQLGINQASKLVSTRPCLEQVKQALLVQPRHVLRLMRKQAENNDRYARTVSMRGWEKALRACGIECDEASTGILLEGCISNDGNVDYKKFCRIWQCCTYP